MSRRALSDLPPDTFDDGRDAERDETVDEPEAELPDTETPEIDFDFEPGAVQAGTEVIRRFWSTLPSSPGVYRMFDHRGDVLYVGKAKNLKARVGSYARGQAHSNRIARMISQTAAMEFVTTATETEALLLEANLIKQLKPRFNVLMRDDKSFPYILVTDDGPAPQIVKHRGARRRKGNYYGPFASVWAVNRTVNALQRAFLLRTCTDSYYENRTRPCLLYQIKRCSGPCTGEIGPEDYAAMADSARAFLAGKSNAVKDRMRAEMQAASEAMEFERAARFRDRIAALSAIQGVQGVNTQGVEEADVFALDEQAGQFCIEVFFFRNFQNWGNRAYFPKADRTMTPDEVLGSFIGQFYDDKPAPRTVLTSHAIEDAELVAAALSSRVEYRVEIHRPSRGERKNLVDYAQRNAKEALARRLADTASQGKLLAALGQAFGLDGAPRRIEVYDNSHIMGTNAVGGMIVAGPTGFMKAHYRTFNIKSEDLTPGDDYGMMREVLQRRFKRLAKEAPRTEREAAASAGEGEVPEPVPAPAEESDAFPAWPDLVLIDGGKGQLEAARAALEEVGVAGVPLVGVAKGRDRDAGRETFFVPGRPPFKLPPRDPTLYFVQRLRDEAHRFAIGSHRAKRKREMVKNPLDEIAGIGPSRKRALLHHFGTVKAIQRAAFEDLARTPGVNAATARAVYDFFHAGA
ncbi:MULTISPECIES: excinuclease ABC subunit UvrC [Methylobacterium]|uniref:excinuclease ABC subunit UvrC n=1 Tax=Methylobacterium TaxID=407 RepID=UPI0007A5CBAB|nr:MULTISPECIES: excinuclease ABC subunit UvrC [Methylobacterium]KZB97674.1 UvrABC system protein C [Methylobacterium radiotolerans]MDE3748259.1 excinuclease ABC subunit UvrC [Methylobacterium radiotolerans]PVY97754.1 excinuclease ABC subunit C [Methylobacterium organophilum]RUP20731.1 MAG: excinuclease ABC subunit UvrC [Methylobacterium sp.]